MQTRSTHVIIDSQALRSNIRLIKEHLPHSTAIMAMVKANAYGHGIIECSRIAVEEGIDYLGIAFASEGVQLRKAGINAKLLLMTPPEPEEFDAIIHHDMETIVCDEQAIHSLQQQSEKVGKIINVHLFIDTGMHRDGIMPEDALMIAQKIQASPNLHFKGLCTHFATADADDTSFMKEQLELFQSCVHSLREANLLPEFIHVGNSAALIRIPEEIGTLARPGLSIYGYSPISDKMPGLQPVMQLHSSVMSVRHIKKGESVSYGRSFIADKDTGIATIPIGYGDGLFRGLSGKLQCIINGRFYPVVGNICMDECMVDIGDDTISIGTKVTFIGTNQDAKQSAEDIALLLQTIPYEITTAISARVPRIIA
ncbi:MAG: alanine racemase [Candidatus Kapaibacteriota bacterium]